MTASNYSLKVNRDLLDPNFESYRLSLDAIPTYNIELDAGERRAVVSTCATRIMTYCFAKSKSDRLV